MDMKKFYKRGEIKGNSKPLDRLTNSFPIVMTEVKS